MLEGLSRPSLEMNTVERILAMHSTEGYREVFPGDIVKVGVDKAIILDMSALHPEFIDNPPKQPFDASKVAIVFDHFVPSPSIEVANAVKKLRELARKWGVKSFYDFGRGGISHTLAAEEGWLLPGRLVANTDSHTCATGAYDCLGRGLGTPELMQVLCTGETWFMVGKTNRVGLEGSLHRGVEAKDVFFKLASMTGGIQNENLEFMGPGIGSLSIDERAVISTMCAEIDVEFVVFPFDGVLAAYLEGRSEGNFTPVGPDADAQYKEEYSVDLSTLSPLVAIPDAVQGNIKDISEVEGTPIDQAVIGSCANGRLSDLKTASEILEGKKVDRGVRLIVTPATQWIYLEAERLGYLEKIVRAGGMITNPTCGSCFGGHMGLLGAGDVCVTSTTRNFKGRMGSRDARIYLASSSTVAASAITGRISDPRLVLAG